MENFPTLPAVTRLSPRVIRILGGNPGKFTLQGTNTYLIGTGRSRLLLDTAEGLPFWKENLEKVLREENATISEVILTHWHPDHVGGIRDVHDLSSGAEKEGEEVRVWKNQTYPSVGQMDFSDGQVFSTPGARITAVHCPGHTVDHMGFLLEEEDAMFTGDNVLGHGTAVFEDLTAYMESLGKMKERFGGRAYPGHGDVVEDGTAKIVEYIAHRKQRETEALETLEGHEDGMGSMEMVKIIYKAYPEHLHGPAEGSLMHVLRKLEGEGKVRESGGRWKLTEKAAL